MIVGLPNALLGYKYNTQFETFFRSLGAEVITSPPTNLSILKRGTEIAGTEFCIPLKVFFGHLAYLAFKECDAIFVPNVISEKKRTFTCPKFLGLSDLARIYFPDTKIIELRIDRRFNLWYKKGRESYRKWLEGLFEIGGLFTKSKTKILLAYCKSLGEKWLEKRRWKSGYAFGYDLTKDGDLTIAVAGHPYNIYDPAISKNLIEKLQRQGVRVVTPEKLSERQILSAACELSKPLYWSYEREVLGAIFHWVNKKSVDGIIYLLSFPCGPDSSIELFIEDKARGSLMLRKIVLDEHASSGRTDTDIEAFLDTLRRRSYKC